MLGEETGGEGFSMGEFQSNFRRFAASGQEGTAAPIRQACWSLRGSDHCDPATVSPLYRRRLERL